MKLSVRAFGLVSLGLLIGVVATSTLACATSGEADPTVGYFQTSPGDSGKEEAAPSVKLNPPSNPNPDENVNEDDDAGTGGGGGNADGGGGDSGGGGGGGDAGTDAGPPPPPPPPPGGSCNATNTCMAATDLGTVSGDTGADSKSAQGYTSQWFTVRVSEDDSSITGIELWMSATLTSPAGTNFDLFVYVPGSDTRECSAVSNSSTSTGASDSTQSKFGESGLFSNGDDDDRTVTVEVRHISGTCDPTAKWTLTVEGNK